MGYVQQRPNVPVDISLNYGIYSLYDNADGLGGIDNGGRTWLRIMTPVVGVWNFVAYTYGHGTSQSRSYPEGCPGLIRGLTGRLAAVPNASPVVEWQQYGPWYDDGMGNFYSDSEFGDVVGGWHEWIGWHQGGHYYDQDELNELLTGATLHTTQGDFEFNADWLDGGEYQSPVGMAVLAANATSPSGSYILTGITGANT